ncbi:MAG: hypothetical protein NT099_07510 [Candidatus Saganbacteria bacterium]|nr:hypothetical protein [Candidatus Saganbacteria bacterium]
MANEMGTVRQIATQGREWWVSKTSHNLRILQQHLTLLQLIKFFPLGLIFLLGEKINQSSGFLVAPGFSFADGVGGGNAIGVQVCFTSSVGDPPRGSGNSPAPTPREIAIIKQIFQDDVDTARTPKQVMLAYNGVHQSNPISLGTAIKALSVLEKELAVKRLTGEHYIYYDQLSHINQVAGCLGRELQKVRTLHELAEVVNSHLKGEAASVREAGPIFGNADFYLCDTPASVKASVPKGTSIPGSLRIVLRMGGDLATSGFSGRWVTFDEDRTRMGEVGVYEHLARGTRTGKDEVVFVPDVVAAAEQPGGFVRSASVAEYRETFERPGEVCWTVLAAGPAGAKRCVGFLKFHRWNQKGHGGENLPFYSANESDAGRRTITAALQSLASTIAENIMELVGDKSVQVVWEEETKNLKRVEEAMRLFPVSKSFLAKIFSPLVFLVRVLVSLFIRKKPEIDVPARLEAAAQATTVAKAEAPALRAAPVQPVSGAAQILPPKASVFLTDDMKFNPAAALPANPAEYHAMMAQLLDANGVFPGDTQALRDLPSFSKPYVVLYRTDRATGQKRKYEIYLMQARNGEEARAMCAPALNRLVFEFDWLSQGAAFDRYGQKGVTYDRKTYYEGRYIPTTHKLIVFEDGMPVAFSALTTAYSAKLADGSEVPYVFIQVMMALGRVQGKGISTYALRELLSQIWMENILRGNHKAVVIDPKTGKPDTSRRKVWIAAHSGRAEVYHLFRTRFHLGPELEQGDWRSIREAIILDADRRITPEASRAQRPMNLDSSWIDPGVYTQNTRYPSNPEGRLEVSRQERELNDFTDWLRAIGGEEGALAGNSLYLCGLLSSEQLRKEKSVQNGLSGDSISYRMVNSIREWGVRRFGAKKG